MLDIYSSEHSTASDEKLLNEDNSRDLEQEIDLGGVPGSIQKKRTWRFLGLLRIISVYTLALWGLVNIVVRITQPIQRAVVNHTSQEQFSPGTLPFRRPCGCGSSIQEAISLGCEFDPVSPAWIQPYCKDAELSAEFETLGDGPNGTWRYFADRNHTQELSMPEVMALGDSPGTLFHVSWEWHVVHCYFYWMKQFRSPRTGIIVEARFDTEAHIRHCGKIFLKRVHGTTAGVVLNADVGDG